MEHFLKLWYIQLIDFKAFEWLKVINECLYINDTTMSYVLNLRLHQGLTNFLLHLRIIFLLEKNAHLIALQN